MTEPVTPSKLEVQSSARQEPTAHVAPSPAEGMDIDLLGEGDFDKAQRACQSLERLGRKAGWALALLGLLVGILSTLKVTVHESPPGRWPAVLLGAGMWALAGGVAGWCLGVVSQAVAAVTVAHLVRSKHDAQSARSQAAQAMRLLERIAKLVEEQGASGATSPSDVEKRKKRAAIEHATRTAAWDDAEELLSQFEAEHPIDPALPELRAALLAARQRAVDDKLAELEAARSANDPARVLEVHETLVRVLDPPARAKLHGDLAPWFLSVIHRRLRVGKIQPDVVRLAERFSEAFSTTVEGASVRASLSTLRRSVGLCPRCSQPYAGVAEACPTCLGRGSLASEEPTPGPEHKTPS